RTRDPSSSASTPPSSLAMSPADLALFLYRRVDVLETTVNAPIWDNVLLIASVIPSASQSCEGLPVRFLSGRTAIEEIGGRRVSRGSTPTVSKAASPTTASAPAATSIDHRAPRRAALTLAWLSPFSGAMKR